MREGGVTIARRLLRWWFAVLVVALITPVNVRARTLPEIKHEGVLRAGVNPNFPPMSVYGSDNQLVGFDVDVARMLANRIGVRLQLVPTETAQRVPFLLSDRIDISLGALTITPERREVIDFSVPLHSESMGVITTGWSSAKSWRDLNRSDVTLANMRGNQSIDIIREKLPNAKLLLVDGNADTIRVIAQRRADALVENVDFFIGFTKNYPDVSWRVLSEPIAVSYCGIGVAKGNRSLAVFLNDALDDLHRSGAIGRLWTHWYGAPMTVPVSPAILAAARVDTATAGVGSDAYSFAFGRTLAKLPYLLGGAVVSLEIAFISFWSGMVIGLLGALGRLYGGEALKRLIGTYVVLLTNTPALVQVFLLYYALPDAGIMLGSMTSVLIGLSLNSGAYLTEILRAGVGSVRRSEMEAAAVLGLGRRQILLHVMLPHIARTIYAPLSNFFVWLVLGSSMAALFGVEELTGRAINISSVNLRTIETFAVVGLIYILLTLLASGSLALVGRYAFRVRVRPF